MKVVSILAFILFSRLCFSQSDTLPVDYLFDSPRNIVWTELKVLNSDEDAALLCFGYNRLNTSERIGNVVSNRYLYCSIGLPRFGRINPEFDRHTLIDITDSSIVNRSMGTEFRHYNVNVGMEFQERTLFSQVSFGGIQIYTQLFGMVGLSRMTEQYVYNTQALGSTQSGSFQNKYDEFDLNPILGERISDYLKLGVGISVGFDFILLYNDKTALSFGINMNFFNLSGLFLMNETVKADADEVFTEPPKKIMPYSNINSSFRIGYLF